MSLGFSTGWIESPDEVERVKATMPIQNVTEVMNDIKVKGDLPESVFLWNACRKVTGDVLRHWNQRQVGSCVGFGTTKACAVRSCVEIAILGDMEEYKELAPEVTYGGSKSTIGGDHSYSDGSVGAWAAKFINTYGVAHRGKYNSIDLSEYSESQCRNLGAQGPPQEVLDECKKHPFKTVSQVTRWDDAKNILAKGGTIMICSNRGFSMQRDQDGVCRPSGSWSHCMALIGYYKDKGFIDNSWDENAFSGPIGPGDGPLTGFYADSNVIESDILRVGDCWAIYDFEGFQKDYTLDYFF